MYVECKNYWIKINESIIFQETSANCKIKDINKISNEDETITLLLENSIILKRIYIKIN
jgi:hypothetical protein